MFRDGDEVELGSRNERPLTRYFPELLDPLLAPPCPSAAWSTARSSCPAATGLDFDALQQRIHPAESRVRRLAAETPAPFVAFDLLAARRRRRSATGRSRERRRLARRAGRRRGRRCTSRRRTTDPAMAQHWFDRLRGGRPRRRRRQAPRPALPPDKRTMVKVKHQRTADCVVAGFRWHKDGEGVGSLLLGLYDDDGRAPPRRRVRQLHGQGPPPSWSTSSSPCGTTPSTITRGGLGGGDGRRPRPAGRMPGAPSRWNAQKDLSWVPLRPERVVEVAFTQLTNGRFRHNAQFLRWRPDREPASCRYDQLEVAVPRELAAILRGRARAGPPLSREALGGDVERLGDEHAQPGELAGEHGHRRGVVEEVEDECVVVSEEHERAGRPLRLRRTRSRHRSGSLASLAPFERPHCLHAYCSTL